MNDLWLSEAVSNNAHWCDAIAKSHDITSRWRDNLWLCEYPMPPLYPNVVTLDSGVQIEESISTIDARLPVGWGIKDSYKELQLQRKHFTIAFEAFWYCREPGVQSRGMEGSGVQVKRVQSAADLNRWVTAWGEKVGIFKASLLQDNDIEFVYAEKDGRLLSGLATNKSGDSVGISNAFGQPEGILDCIEKVCEFHPSRGIVGYGDQAEVDTLMKVGFRVVGELQVWLRS